jgi:predicted dinucleotide-binding enzyme
VTKIGILGAGKVGTSLARAAIGGGYEVDIAGSGSADRIQLIMNYWTPIDGEISDFDDAPEVTSVLVQRALPDSRVVKTLNHIGYHELDEEPRPVGAPDRMALGAVGDDPDAVAAVLAFLERIGFDAIDGGALANGAAFQPGSLLFGAPYRAERFCELLATELARAERTKIAA